MGSTMTRTTERRGGAPGPAAGAATPPGGPFAGRRLRRLAVRGPRCPHCAGPLVHGEGRAGCPVCGYVA